MKTKNLFKYIALPVILVFVVGGVFPGGVKSGVAQDSPSPYIMANPDAHWIYAYYFLLNTPIHLTINDPITESVYEEWTTAWDGGNITTSYFDLNNFILEPNMEVIVSDGTNEKHLIVADFSVMLDVINNTLSGTASPEGNVFACANDAPGNCRFATADEHGDWSMAPDPEGFVLAPGVSGWAAEGDGDGDMTRMDWRVPAPIIAANPFWDSIFASGMPIGSILTLTVMEDGETVLQSAPTPIDQNPDDPNDISARFTLNGFDVKPGQELIVAFGDESISYTVTDFQITSIDLVWDTISGIATPSSQMQICVDVGDHCVLRYPLANSDGIWIADFGNQGQTPGEREVTDIRPGSYGWGNEKDIRGNETWSAWNVPNPRFEVRPNIDQVRGWEWTVGETLALEIGGQVYTGVVVVTPWDPNQSYIEFNLAGIYDIKPGDIVSLTNGSVTKTTTVTELQITAINIGLDTVSGKAAIGSNVDLWAYDGITNYYRYLTAGDNGLWSADFSPSGSDGQNPYDIVAGTWIDSQQVDEDGDATMYGVNVPNPNFVVNPTGHWACAWDWPAGVELILAAGEFSTSATNYATGPLSSEACFDLTAVELSPGDEVFVSGAGIDKSLVVTNFSVVLDVLNNSLSGTASPEGSVFACADNASGNCRFATADENGDWTIAPDPEGFVLAPGVYGWAAEGDQDGDMTRMDWWAPMPTSGRATGEGWFISPAGAYAANPAYTGEASLEFDAKYVNKKPNLFGSLQFSFPRFSFDSTTLDWLLVDNGRMLLSGQGKISGKNGYSFMLSAADNPPGMNGKDTVHIRIWETATGNVIYDNMQGIPDYEMPISILQGDGITLIQ